ncbi:MAG TPA: efflux RND transporter permease subunit [Longimicrobiales bacterium]|nr:efflux RND transporter permease subunit [Longimicrobiales bacterium]
MKHDENAAPSGPAHIDLAQAAGRAGALSDVAIQRPVFTAMMMLGLIVLGIFSFRQLPIDQFPDVDIPIISVQTVYPGASPETVEREVTRRLEEAFNPVEGVDRITSISLESVSQVVIEFDLKRDGDQAAQDIRSKIDVIRRQLPADAEQPVVQKFDPSDQPIVSLALSSTTSGVPELTRLADEAVRRRLESVDGVGNVQIAGGLEREIRVYIDPAQMQAYGVSIPEVMGALQRQNVEAPAGRVERGTQEQLVRVIGRIRQPSEFSGVVVANRNGNPVRLGQIARIEDATEEERSLAFVNNQRAVSLDIQKVSGANTVAVADGVKEEVAVLSAALPAGVQLAVVRDNSEMIRHSVEDVIFELLLGALLTVFVVMIFLNDWKATAITSLALPVSVISSFILMNALGFTLNVLTLMALSLSIGILIDDAIVVIENIVRHRELGEDHFSAAKWGTREIFLAVMATTFTIVAVFAPVAFMKGIIGRFFFEFGLTVAWAVLVSLFVSFTLTPMLAAWWGVDPHGAGGGHGNILTRGIGRFNSWFDAQADRYRGIVDWALHHRKATLGIAGASFVGAFMLFPFIGGGFFPESDEGMFGVMFETPEGSSLQYTRSRADAIIATLGEIEGVAYTYTTIGAGATGTVTGGSVYVQLEERGERDRDQAELMTAARERLATLYGVTTAVGVADAGPGGAKPLMINIRGADVTQLQRLSDEVLAIMKELPGIVDVEASLGAPRPELRIEVNRELANELGLDVGQIAGTVRPLLAGQVVTRWEDPTGEERDVVLQVDPQRRASLEDVAALPIATPFRAESGAAPTVPLGQVARITRGNAPAQIDRSNLERVATVSASTVSGYSIGEASSVIRAQLAGLQVPEGFDIQLGGETEQLEETFGYVVETMLLAVILIFLILASQFESFTQPFAIMLSLPLSLIGVLLALLITDDTLNMMSMIGVIMLMGLVTKNAILLVDNANERRGLGMDRHRALVEAGRVRLRPIIMTTAAMICGMLPIALALGQGGSFRAPMARAVIGGLITSTLLTLVVVPVAYTYFDDIGSWVRRRLVSEERERQLEREREEAGIATEKLWGSPSQAEA